LKQQNLQIRGDIILGVIGLIVLIMIGRLYSLQVLTEEYAGQAREYSRKRKPMIPPRGNLYNRYGQIYVSNSAMFDLAITPKELQIPDTNLLCQYLDMSRQDLRDAIAKAQKAPNKEHVISRYIDPVLYGALQENLWNFSGISFNVSNRRTYNEPVGANFLGYISEVNPGDIEASEGYFKPGDLKGKSGIENSYESVLRGKKGEIEVLKDKYGREVGSYASGKYDLPAIKGADLLLGIDTDLQGFGEALMQNKKGSIVALEPSSGEILAFISAPTYDPRELMGRELRRNWRRLRNDTLRPLFNRPLMATYPPGSIYKTAMALAALNEGVISPSTSYSCGGGFWRNGGKPGCRLHPHPLRLSGAIKYSCNAYFAATYMDMLNHKQYKDVYESFETWHKYMEELGLGRKMKVDLPYEGQGLLPSAKRYDRIYGENRWGATNVISNAIGQGEILMTPLQMANMVAIIANRGFYYPPHFVKGTKPEGLSNWQSLVYERQYTSIRREHYQTVADAMEQVVATGTARRAFLSDIVVCGKTGTVENPHGEDHATFIAFAPKENPRIAIAVVIENSGGGGGRWAAPTAALMIEKYLKRSITEKTFELKRITEADFISP
jgi:penicillin-binding protein 2